MSLDRRAHLTAELESDAVRLNFNRRLMLQLRGLVVTSDAGLLAYRELDDALGLTEMAGETLADARTGRNGRRPDASESNQISPRPSFGLLELLVAVHTSRRVESVYG
jgi:hypothetical protein